MGVQLALSAGLSGCLHQVQPPNEGDALAPPGVVSLPEIVDGSTADTQRTHAGLVMAGEALDDRLGPLRQCLGELHKRARQMLQLRYAQALPIRRIAERRGQSTAAVEMALVRVRRGLRECVERKLARAGGGAS